MWDCSNNNENTKNYFGSPVVAFPNKQRRHEWNNFIDPTPELINEIPLKIQISNKNSVHPYEYVSPFLNMGNTARDFVKKTRKTPTEKITAFFRANKEFIEVQEKWGGKRSLVQVY